MKSNHINYAHPLKMKNFRRHANEKSHYKQKKQKSSKYKRIFYLYFHFYHKHGQKDTYCRIKEEDQGLKRKEDTNISNGEILITCFICHNDGHFAKKCKNSTCILPKVNQENVW